jgi:hypothetical protein
MKPGNMWRSIPLFCVLLTACGSSSQQGDGGGTPPASDTIGTLNDSQLGALCDQLAATAGGYGHTKTLTCDAATEMVSFQIGANQTQCKQLLKTVGASCAVLTVGELQGCVTDTYAVTCASPSPFPPSCDPFFSCVVSDASVQ